MKQTSFYTFLLYLVFFAFLFPDYLFADDTTSTGVLDTFENYEIAVKDICESPNVPWANYRNALTLTVIKPNYPSLEWNAVSTEWQRFPSTVKTDSERKVLEEYLSPEKLDAATFSSVKLAGAEYRKIMDDTYACAVINGRIHVLSTLRKLIEKQNTGMTEIRIKLKTLEEALIQERQRRGCKEIRVTGFDSKRELLDATMYQYCVYRHYMTYIRDTLQYKANTLLMNEKNVRAALGAQSVNVINTDHYLTVSDNLMAQIESEIARARDVYSQAFVAYGEMERTYGIHILLEVLTDDYIQFRENLKNFMNPVSQFFQKVVNAQSKNPPPQ